MEQILLEEKPTSLSAGEEMNAKFADLVHKGPPLVHILSQMNPVHSLLPYFLKINFNIILSICI
jgi:hypothetical protein